MVNLATLEQLESDWNKFLNLRSKISYNKDILKKTDPNKIEKLRTMLRKIITNAKSHYDNSARLIELAEKLPEKAKNRFIKLINNIENIYNNSRTQLSSLS